MAAVRGIRRGRDRGIDRGISRGASWTKDATSNKATPITSIEVSALLASAGITATCEALYLFGAPASGNVSDSSGNSRTLTASGTLAYQQSVSGWTSKAITCTEGVSGFLATTSLPQVSANDHTLILIANIPTTGAAFRALCHMGDAFDASVCLETTLAQVLQCGVGGGGRIVGAATATGATRPYILVNDASTDAYAITNQETLSGSPSNTATGTELKFGGDGVDSWLPASTAFIHAYVINKALTIPEAQALLTASGW